MESLHRVVVEAVMVYVAVLRSPQHGLVVRSAYGVFFFCLPGARVWQEVRRLCCGCAVIHLDVFFGKRQDCKESSVSSCFEDYITLLWRTQTEACLFSKAYTVWGRVSSDSGAQ